MNIQRLTQSRTAPEYLIRFESPAEAALTLDQLIDKAEPLNFGGQLIARTPDQIRFKAFVD